MKMSGLDWAAWVLVILGALNWGFVGLADLNLVESLLGTSPQMVQFVYVLVGLGGLYSLWKVKAVKK